MRFCVTQVGAFSKTNSLVRIVLIGLSAEAFTGVVPKASSAIAETNETIAIPKTIAVAEPIEAGAIPGRI